MTRHNPPPSAPPRTTTTKPPLFFIVGHERSGTTLMAAILDRHTRIAVPPETHFFSDLCPAHAASQTNDPVFMVNHFFRGARIRDLQLNPSDLLHRLTLTQPTWANLFQEALNLYAQRHNKPHVGEKTPNHWRHVPELLNLFPNSRIIWLIRDGRDAILSLLKTPWKPHANLAKHAIAWCNTARQMLQNESQFPHRILRIHFENLLTNPAAQLHRVCQFINIDFEPRQLDPSTPTSVVPAWELPWKNRVFAPPDPTRIGAALRELPPHSLQLLNTLMRPTLHQLRYPIHQAAA